MSDNKKRIDVVAAVGWADAQEGVKISDLKVGDKLKVLTMSGSEYIFRFTKPVDGEAVATGGKFGVAETSVAIAGATFGGSCIKLDWIMVGMCLEMYRRRRKCTSTPVTTIYRYL